MRLTGSTRSGVGIGATLVAGLLAGGLVTGCGILPAADPASVARPEHRTTPGPRLYADVAQRMVAARTAQFVFSGNGGGETFSGSGAMRFTENDAFAADVTLTMPQTGRVRAVLAPVDAYLALPAAKGVPRSKSWVKVSGRPTTRVGRQLMLVVEQLRSAFDPAQSLGLLRSARRVQEIGPSMVESEPATRYRAHVDLRRASRAAVGPARKQYRTMLAAGATTLRYDIWVDISGLPRRYSADLPTAGGLFSVTGVFRSWGSRVKIARPDPKQIFDADKLKG